MNRAPEPLGRSERPGLFQPSTGYEHRTRLASVIHLHYIDHAQVTHGLEDQALYLPHGG